MAVKNRTDFFRKNGKNVYQYIRKIATKFFQNDEICNDLTQDIILKIFINYDSFNSKSRLETWIYSIARNHCINYKQRIFNKEKVLREQSDLIYYQYSTDNVENNLFIAELKQNLAGYLKKLPEQQKIPLILFYFERRKYSDIASVLQIPIGTVKSRINTAKKRLQKILLKHMD